MGARILRASFGRIEPAPGQFLCAVELRQHHTTYFSAIVNAEWNNFFGAFVSPTPVEQVLQVPHLDATSIQPARLHVSLQGVITGFPHDVTVVLNGTSVGDDMTGRLAGITCPTLIVHGTADAAIPPGAGRSRPGRPLGGPVTFIVVEGAAHASNVTHPDEVNQAIFGFLSGLDGG